MKTLTFIVPIKKFGTKERDKMKYSLNRVWAAGPGSQWERKAKAQMWHDEVNAILEDLNPAPFDTKVDFEFKYVFAKNSLDTSNCAVMSKLIEDALVRNGIILGDENDKVGTITTESINLPLTLRRKLTNDYVEVTVIERNASLDEMNLLNIGSRIA